MFQLRFAVLFTTFLCSGISSLPGQHVRWETDEFGHPYYDAYVDGVAQRVYEQPVRQAAAREAARQMAHLSGVPVPNQQPHTGIDAHGRRWRRDEYGYRYYEAAGLGSPRVYYQPDRRSAAVRTRQQLRGVDWPEAIRAASRNVVIRSLNGDATSADAQAAVRDAMIANLNRLDERSSQPLQAMVTAGIEDALVEAFNGIATPSELFPRQLLPQEPDGRAPARNIPPSLIPKSLFPRRPFPHRVIPEDPLEPTRRRLDGPFPLDPAFGLDAQRRQEILERLIPPLNGAATVYGAEGALNRSRAAAPPPADVHRRVTKGWIVNRDGVRLLSDPDGYELVRPAGDGDRLDVWRNGQRLYRGVQFAQYREDADALFRQSPRRASNESPGDERRTGLCGDGCPD